MWCLKWCLHLKMYYYHNATTITITITIKNYYPITPITPTTNNKPNHSVDCQHIPTPPTSTVLITITGRITLASHDIIPKDCPFVQTFVLRKREGGKGNYMLVNDAFRFLRQLTSADVAEDVDANAGAAADSSATTTAKEAPRVAVEDKLEEKKEEKKERGEGDKKKENGDGQKEKRRKDKKNNKDNKDNKDNIPENSDVVESF